MGTGGIANAFAEALHCVSDAELVAVGSRTIEKAAEFSKRHGTPIFTLEEGLVGLPGVEVVYVASPASCHYEHTLMALRAGKHVLCEKPFAMNAMQAEGMTAWARDQGLFLMEAMWCRFLPSYIEIRRLLAEGAVGEILAVEATSGIRAQFNAATRPFQPELGGGALYDAAVYSVSFAQMVLGTLSQISGVGRVGKSGVDEQAAILACGPAHELALMAGGITTTFSGEAHVYGSEGMLVVPGPHYDPSWVKVLYPGREPLHVDTPHDRHRLAYQVDEVHRCISGGLVESPVMPHASSVEVMRVLDDARIGVYACP